jgi:adenylate cyclase
MVKFIARFIRTLGLVFIISFSFFSIIVSSFINDVDNNTFIGKVLEYTSFIENRFYDSRMKASLDPSFKSQDIALVKIDDYSLQKIGSWPIPRTIHAKMIKKLKTFGAKVVAMDVMFPEKAPACGADSPDRDFAKALKDFQRSGDSKAYLAYTIDSNPDGHSSGIPAAMDVAKICSSPQLPYRRTSQFWCRRGPYCHGGRS